MSLDRFWNKVDATGPCWLWTARVDRNGYGMFTRSNHDEVYAHRMAYELLVEPIPEGLELDHICRVRNCVNVDHLEAVTHAENMRRSRKSHCKYGHAMVGDNIYPRPDKNTHECRQCTLDRAARSRACR